MSLLACTLFDVINVSAAGSVSIFRRIGHEPSKSRDDRQSVHEQTLDFASRVAADVVV
jgi:hypothetical protein